MLEMYRDYEIHASYLGYGYDAHNPYDNEISAWGFTIDELKELIDVMEDE